MNGFIKKIKSKKINKLYNLFKSIPKISLYAKKNWKKLLNIEFPNNKLENWKYTSIDQIFEKELIFAQNCSEISEKIISKFSIPKNAIRLIYINGKFNFQLSDKKFDFFKIAFSPLLDIDKISFQKEIQPDFFLYLVEALAINTTEIVLEKNRIAPRPLYLLHISSSHSSNNILYNSYYRHHIKIQKNSKAEIIEHYVSLSEFSHFTGVRIKINLEKNASLLHTKLSSENKKSYHFSHNDFFISNKNNVISKNFMLGNNIHRHNISIKMNGKKSKLKIFSLSLPMHSEISDIRTYLEHNNELCYSRQLHKIIVLDKAVGVFNGIIKVSKNAFNTDGKMNNKNLLLGNKAQINTKPQLEIYADNVKCSHGVTISHFEKLQIFYLCSRGINYFTAKKMIIYAFSFEIINLIEDINLKNTITSCINKRFLGKKNDF